MREFTIPPLVTAPQVGGLADSVFAAAAEEPDRVVLARRSGPEGAEWEDVTMRPLPGRGPRRGQGPAGARHPLRRPGRPDVPHPLRVDRAGLRAVDDRRSAGADLPDVLLRAGALDAARLGRGRLRRGARGPRDDHRRGRRRTPRLARLWQLDSDALTELARDGAEIDDDVVHRHRMAVTPNGPATVIYTSGTTGKPKGCVITHANFMAEADNVIAKYEPVFHSKPGDEASTLLFLPLAHVFGRMVEVAAVRARVRLGHQPNLAAAELLPHDGLLQADLRARGPVRLREGLPGRTPQGRGRMARSAPSRRPSRSPCGTRRRWRRAPSAPAPAPAPDCGCSTSCTRSWSTARCARPSAARSGTRSPAARRWTGGSGCSSTARACGSSRGTD